MNNEELTGQYIERFKNIKGGLQMQVKVVELIGESNESWNDAVQQAVIQASKTIPNISGVEVYNLTAGVSSGRLSEYKANVKIAYSDGVTL